MHKFSVRIPCLSLCLHACGKCATNQALSSFIDHKRKCIHTYTHSQKDFGVTNERVNERRCFASNIGHHIVLCVYARGSSRLMGGWERDRECMCQKVGEGGFSGRTNTHAYTHKLSFKVNWKNDPFSFDTTEWKRRLSLFAHYPLLHTFAHIHVLTLTLDLKVVRLTFAIANPDGRKKFKTTKSVQFKFSNKVSKGDPSHPFWIARRLF